MPTNGDHWLNRKILKPSAGKAKTIRGNSYGWYSECSGVLEQKVDLSLARLTEIEGRGIGESYSLNGNIFRSQGEVKVWLETNEIKSVGVFWDLCSVLCCMKPKKHSGKARADESYSAKRINSTAVMNNLCASMSHIRPEVFYAKKGSGTLEPLENGFAACTSYDKWVTGAEGYKQVLSTMLTNFTAGVMGLVITGNNPAITSLAGALMGSLIGQWHNLCNFIDSFYIELTRLAAFNQVSAWQLVGRCVGALFSAMAPYRAPVTMLDEMDDWDARAACVWAVMQCHRVGWAFDLVKYRGHPAVVKEMSLFLLTERVDPSEITACTERSKKAEKDASELKSEMAKLKEVVNSLNREVKTAQGELKNLRNRN